ncbi:MAG: hypothetical protein ACLP05_09280 [Candidatus Kryptoniota bacterium]
MAGQVKALIDKIITERSKGNPTIVVTTRTKLILKGIDPDKWDTASPDDFQMISKVRQVAQELGVKL